MCDYGGGGGGRGKEHFKESYDMGVHAFVLAQSPLIVQDAKMSEWLR